MSDREQWRRIALESQKDLANNLFVEFGPTELDAKTFKPFRTLHVHGIDIEAIMNLEHEFPIADVSEMLAEAVSKKVTALMIDTLLQWRKDAAKDVEKLAAMKSKMKNKVKAEPDLKSYIGHPIEMKVQYGRS